MFPIWTIWAWNLDWPPAAMQGPLSFCFNALSLSLLPCEHPHSFSPVAFQLSHKMETIFHSSSCCHNCSSWGLTPPTSLPNLSPKWKFHLNTISACVGSRPEVPVCSWAWHRAPTKQGAPQTHSVETDHLYTTKREQWGCVRVCTDGDGFRGGYNAESSSGALEPGRPGCSPCFTSSMCLMVLG